MAFFPDLSKGARSPASGTVLSRANFIVFLLLAAAAVLSIHGFRQMEAPLSQLQTAPVSLDPANLPEYALRTTLRMFAALVASLLFTFVVGTLAAKSRKAELVIIPALDILQSVPVLGFLTFTVTFFMSLFPGSQLGAECTAVFAVFTAQAWNMTFSFYQSLRTIPAELDDVARQFGFSPWQRFVQLELPFAMRGLIWNTMMSMSGGWFFVVASEAITVGNTTVTLPGIGAWISLAIQHKDFTAMALAVAAMAVVIVLYDQLVFRPIIAWADKFRFEHTASQTRPTSWLYNLLQCARLPGMLRFVASPPGAGPRPGRASRGGSGLGAARRFLGGHPFQYLNRSGERHARILPRIRGARVGIRVPDAPWNAIVILACCAWLWLLAEFILHHLTWSDVATTSLLGLATMARVVLLIVIASVIWVPIGVWIGLRPRWSERVQALAQFLAAFPADILFPFAVIAIVGLHLNPNVWLSPLMILGTQWYILFNVIAGASAIPTDMQEATRVFGIRGWQWWKQFALPAIFPYYVTGALTASGGSWNASIVAEAVSWGDRHLQATGLGSFIANATQAGDNPRLVLGIVVMSVFVIIFNRVLWRPLYRYAERRLHLD